MSANPRTAGEVLRLNAGNDTNGNPRRVYVAILDGEIVGAWDEGYKGSGAVPEEWRRRIGPSFLTTPLEYREILSRREWYAAQYVERALGDRILDDFEKRNG